MFKSISLLLFCTLFFSVFGQTPEKFSYQSIIRNSSNNLVSNQSVGLQVSIIKNNVSGTSVYIERHTASTNNNGLLSIEIGTGTVLSGSMQGIDWSNGPFFIKTETDPSGGTSYTISGTSQLLSVPYALYAKNSSSWQINEDTVYTLKKVSIGGESPYIGVELHTEDSLFATHVIESKGNNTDAEIWLKNKKGVWRMHGDNSDENKFKIGLWTDYSENGGSNILPHALTIDSIGNVGIGTSVPKRKLHVNNVMRLEPRTTAPLSPSEGDIYMNATSHKLMVFDGTIWRSCW